MMTPANQLLAALPGALAAGQFEPYFQPRVNLRTGQVLGAEALVRWRHPDEGILDPGAFLELFAGKRMRGLTEQVIESSVRAAGDWWRSGLGLRVTVNLPAEAFAGADWRLETVAARALADSQLPGDALSFEIGEDILLAQPESTGALLERLRALGPGIALQQFSPERSTIDRLAGLPLEELKIPRSTTRTLFDRGGTAAIRSIVDLARERGLRTTAVGVESRETWRRLRGIGCDRAQGNLISKPLPGREIPRWLVGWGQQSRRQRLIAPHGRHRKRGIARAAQTAA